MHLKKDFFGYELVVYNDNKNLPTKSINPIKRDYNADAKFRAKRNVIEYAMNNDFNWFVTITFDKNKINRYDPKLLEKKVRQWLNNTRLNYDSKAKYIMVPEYHKDKAVHYHLLIKMENNKLKYLYNHRHWKKAVYKDTLLFKKFGRNEWVNIKSYTEPIGLYLSKYITKLPDKMNTQYYFASQDLNKSEKIDLKNDFIETVEALKGIQPTAATRFCTIYRFGIHEKNKIFDLLKIV
jgi:hypothetical protein